MKNIVSSLAVAMFAIAGCSVEARGAGGSAPAMERLKVGEVLPLGWIKAQMQQDVTTGYLPSLPELTPYVTIETFNAAAKSQMVKPRIGADWWSGEQTGCWLDGYVGTAYLSGDQDAIKRVDGLVNRILGFQEADGYLGIAIPSARYLQPIPFSNGELWAQTTLFRGLLAYYELTGRQDVFNAVKRAVDLSISQYNVQRQYWREKIPRGGPGHCLMFVDICEWMHRLTGEQKYVDFAQFLYDSYNERTDVFEYDCLLKNLSDPQKMLNGHGVHALEHVRVPFFLQAATGNTKYDPVANYPAKIKRHLNAGGAVICDEDIGQRLGNPDIGCEFCTMQELLDSMGSIFQKTGAAFAGDWMEKVAFNAVQGARMKDGRAIAYLSSDNQPEASVGRGHGGRFKFSPTHEDVALCCVNWAVRFYPYYVNHMWMRDATEAGLVACTYGPAVVKTKINGVSVSIEEQTAYPFEDQVEFVFTVDKPSAFPVYFRNPGWSENTEVIADGATVSRADGFIKVQKKWRTGDRVKLLFGAKIERKEMPNGDFYWVRGPLTYALQIPSETRKIKAYGETGFFDYDVVPMAKASANYAMDRGCGDFVFERDVSDPRFPWRQAGLQLRGKLFNRDSKQAEDVVLVPEGTALLRQTTFQDMEPIRVLADPSNLALKAKVAVSSESKSHPASGINDGLADGHPTNPAAEWASNKETTGAKVKLTWPEPIVIENVWFFDRPNSTDHVLNAWVNFSDGSSQLVEELANDGSAPFQLNFPEKQITWMEVIITRTSPGTKNAGFSEIAVYKDLP